MNIQELQTQELYTKASEFIYRCYREWGQEEAEAQRRLDGVREAILTTGRYEHTSQELEYGARMAWRNSNRCIGRLFWETLHVFDARGLSDAQQVADALLRHIDWATNGGRIRPAITVFRAGGDRRSEVRLWNHQLIRYAGYETDKGVVGDPASITFTKVCQSLGWRGEGTAYDLLPLVVQIGQDEPQWFPLDRKHVLEVPIRHPQLPEFDKLGLQWYGVPIVSDMRLEIGGIPYPAAPFNGWYMGTEIGARNLADTNRYNMLPAVARAMGLDPSAHASTLWKDRALVELNAAVLDSYKNHGVTIVDHHTASTQFQRFEEREAASGREVTGRWSWLIPPLSPASTAIFHASYTDQEYSPCFQYQDKLY